MAAIVSSGPIRAIAQADRVVPLVLVQGASDGNRACTISLGMSAGPALTGSFAGGRSSIVPVKYLSVPSHRHIARLLPVLTPLYRLEAGRSLKVVEAGHRVHVDRSWSAGAGVVAALCCCTPSLGVGPLGWPVTLKPSIYGLPVGSRWVMRSARQVSSVSPGLETSPTCRTARGSHKGGEDIELSSDHGRRLRADEGDDPGNLEPG